MAAGEDEGEFFNTQIACLKRQEHSQVAKQGREDFLSYIEDKNINQLMLMETLELIIGFGVQFDLLDQTILQAIQFLQSYLAINTTASSSMLKEIAVVCIELAIKNNEDMVLKLNECVNILDSFNTKQLHLTELTQPTAYSTNPVASLD